MAGRRSVNDHAPLIGEPIPDLPRSPIIPIPSDTIRNLDSLSNSELIGLVLRHGIDAREALGEPNCTFHSTGSEANLWKLLPANRIMHHSLQVGIDVVWCRGCFEWFRLT
jgi:hypothetical protein